MPSSIRILHICTEKDASARYEKLAELADYLESRVEEQVFMCRQASALQLFCNESGLISFPISVSVISRWSNAALLRNICENYNINIIHSHDAGSHAIVALAMNKKWKIPFAANAIGNPGWLAGKFLRNDKVSILEDGNEPPAVLEWYKKLVK